MSLLKKASGIAAAAVAALTLSALTLTAPVADAHPNTVVVFGDSEFANPSVSAWLPSLPTSSSVNYTCPQDPDGPAKQIGRNLGLNVADYSCTGASVWSGNKKFEDQVSRAIAEGALAGDTPEVVINIGINDALAQQRAGIDPNVTVDGYRYLAGLQIDRIRAAAPNADIAIAGYPQITDGGAVCLLHVGNNLGTREPLPLVANAEATAQRMQSDLARDKGVQFVDVKGPSQGHSMCAPDGQRWVVGAVDLVTAANMPGHMSHVGKQAVGRIVADAIRG